MRNENGLTLEEFLAKYDENKYRRPSATVDMAVFTLVDGLSRVELALMLIKRRNHPFIGEWALPGGFVEFDEDIEVAAARELCEETGVSGAPMVMTGTFGKVGRDPRTRVISTGFLSLVPMGELDPAAGDDAADAALFTVETELEAFSAPADAYRMTLIGPRVIVARARLVYNELGAQCAASPNGGLASDHGAIVLAALRRLAAMPHGAAARYLTRGCSARFNEAEEAIERALGPLTAAE